MLILVELNRYGHLEAEPASERRRAAIVRDARSNGAPEDFDGRLYVQVDHDVDAFLEALPGCAERDIRGGWMARVRLDTWTYRHWLGYAAD